MLGAFFDSFLNNFESLDSAPREHPGALIVGCPIQRVGHSFEEMRFLASLHHFIFQLQ